MSETPETATQPTAWAERLDAAQTGEEFGRTILGLIAAAEKAKYGE